MPHARSLGWLGAGALLFAIGPHVPEITLPGVWFAVTFLLHGWRRLPTRPGLPYLALALYAALAIARSVPPPLTHSRSLAQPASPTPNAHAHSAGSFRDGSSPRTMLSYPWYVLSSHDRIRTCRLSLRATKFFRASARATRAAVSRFSAAASAALWSP